MVQRSSSEHFELYIELYTSYLQLCCRAVREEARITYDKIVSLFKSWIETRPDCFRRSLKLFQDSENEYLRFKEWNSLFDWAHPMRNHKEHFFRIPNRKTQPKIKI
ncbi:hypothetical protein EFP84_04830 [Leptospira kmetyi]|uniref:Uncharacterized protein n=1 Tax=Leptospira kmetyi TaxID=408139 RepID=A0AAD0UNA8_9LEPT|nr:hypothetical protein EFP84_04830 [Leptospira kmetyi]